ncbi:GntR family transcriptional regulator [Simiduia sp. 21SJ11W-1]|uniref:GntR family transcriptional regulator n=1 Tax=Simiduia sp. 21SJ11W-1 TaxID=2909669 RepID=UPI00209D90DC|nr:GntR family transcriptional regulator [Simiduia sp. 21SJ11W-1]UTA48295.1 GntR family transcriptional regulator [Simiduia sp. 21SJ11W-1]
MAMTRKQQRLHQQLLALIDELPPGARLPGERDLAELTQVSRDTLRRALKHLEEIGRIEIRQGAGIFVLAKPLANQLKLMSFSEEMQQLGLKPTNQLLFNEVIKADVKISNKMNLAPGSELFLVRRLRLADDCPVAIERVYLPKAIFPELEIQQLRTGSLYEILYRQYDIVVDQAKQQISATVVNEEEAELLQIPTFSPALLAERTVYDEQGRIIELAKSLYRADRYRFNVLVQRNGTRLATVYE